MDLYRHENKAIASSARQCVEIDVYIRIIIDIYSSSEISREFWLTEREKEFYIATIIHILNGHLNPIAEESIQIYKKYFNNNTDKAKISDYINRIRKKSWLKYNKRSKVVEIPPIFHGINLTNDYIRFNLNFVYEQVDRSDTDGNSGQEHIVEDHTYST